MGQFAPIPGSKAKRRTRQAPQHCGELVFRITERLEGRVKGLTSVFPALLLTGKLASSALKDFFTSSEDRPRQEGDQQEHELWRQ
jgi:hypothetical protein